MLTHKTGNLFDVEPNKGNVLVHACNAKGVWGAGVAAQMRRRFPRSYGIYLASCKSGARPGNFLLLQDDGYWTGSIITSNGYGMQVDSPDAIIEATQRAVNSMLHANRECWAHAGLKFHSPRINAGLFGVPWEETEAVLRPLVEQYDVDWTVWTP